jgi:hypothetical protein
MYYKLLISDYELGFVLKESGTPSEGKKEIKVWRKFTGTIA